VRNYLTIAVLAFLCVAGDLNARPVSNSSKSRPNVLFIITDDQSPFDLKVYNPESELQTPNIDRLAKSGITIDGAYHMGSFSGAVCTPSRHMVMTGRTLWHLPIGPEKGSTNPNCPANIVENCMAEVFNRAGYVTMRTCKTGNSYAGANKKFQIVHDAVKRGGTAESGSAWHADKVLGFLDQREADTDKKPFLIYYGFSHPHDVRDGTPELLAKYGATNHKDKSSLPPFHDKQPKLPSNYLPHHPFEIGHPALRDEADVEGVWGRRDERTIRNEIGRQFACAENIDIQIGRVLSKLEAIGELNNTFVFFTSDHGMAIGRHGLQGKQNLYEHTWRVPMIVKGPGIAVGKRAQGNVYLLDVLNTMCELTGVAAPESNEGISFADVAQEKRSTIRDVMYGAYCGGTKPGIRCVKQGDWKLIQYDVLGRVKENQLFNLSGNPHEFLVEHPVDSVQRLSGRQPSAEQRNLAYDRKHEAKLAEMQELLQSEMARLDDPYELWNQKK